MIPHRFLPNGVREKWHDDRVYALRTRLGLGSSWSEEAQTALEWLLEDRARKVPKALTKAPAAQPALPQPDTTTTAGLQAPSGPRGTKASSPGPQALPPAPLPADNKQSSRQGEDLGELAVRALAEVILC